MPMFPFNKSQFFMRSWLLLYSLAAVACSAPVTRDFSFESNPDVALVIASVPAASFARNVCLQKYSPTTNVRAKAFAAAGCFGSYKPFGDESREFVAIALEPGDYFVSQVSVGTGGGRTVRALSRNVITFQLSKQQILYLGDFDVTDFATASHIGFSEPEVSEFLDGYPNLPDRFEKAKIVYKEVLLP